MRLAQYRYGVPSWLLSFFVCIACVSCSDNQSSTPQSQDTPPEPATGLPTTSSAAVSDDAQNQSTNPILSLAAEPGHIMFSWSAPVSESLASITTRIIRYNLVTREYTPVFSTTGNLRREFRLPLAAHRTDWNGTRFLLEHCSAEQCSFSDGQRIDHLKTELHTQITRQSVGSQQRYSHSIALSSDGNVLISGTPGTNNALVQFRIGEQWWESATLNSDLPDIDTQFAHSVAISGDGNTIIVGAPREKNQSSGADGGAVYVFERFGEGWVNTAKLNATDSSQSRFGSKVAISTDATLLLVAVPNATISTHAKAGKVLAFERISSQWQLIQTLQSDVPNGLAEYGSDFSYASDQRRLFVSDKSAHGQVHVYEWDQGQFSAAPGLQNTIGKKPIHENTQFAESIATDNSGNTLVVSRRTLIHDDADETVLLQVEVYQRSNGGDWKFQQSMTPPDVESKDSRMSLFLSGDTSTLSIGLTNPNSSRNNVTSYSSDRSWTTGGYVWAHNGTLYSPGSGDDEFASVVALSDNGQTLLVTAPGTEREGLKASGTAYVW